MVSWATKAGRIAPGFVDGAARDYAEAVLALPALKTWVADALAETERIEKFERDA